MVKGREVKKALTKALELSAHDYLVNMRGQDLPDELLILEDFDFEIQPLGVGEFAIRAKELNVTGVNQPALFFAVKVTGGG
jgi:hypothetical protein